MKNYYVYILAAKKNGTIYTGFTEALIKRIWEHKNGLAEGFTKKYNVKNLVYYETFDNYEAALAREKQLKKWRRESKLKLIEEMNPKWEDLYERICK